jgi:hypothetical protein
LVVLWQGAKDIRGVEVCGLEGVSIFGRGLGSLCARRSNRFVWLGSLLSLLVILLALIAIRTTLRRLLVATKALRLLSRLRIAICPSD